MNKQEGISYDKPLVYYNIYTLLYGVDCLSMSVNTVAMVQSAQGNIMK